MSSSKAALKAVKAAIDAHKYTDAAGEAEKVLEKDKDNYYASACLVTCRGVTDPYILAMYFWHLLLRSWERMTSPRKPTEKRSMRRAPSLSHGKVSLLSMKRKLVKRLMNTMKRYYTLLGFS